MSRPCRVTGHVAMAYRTIVFQLPSLRLAFTCILQRTLAAADLRGGSRASLGKWFVTECLIRSTSS